MVVVKAVLIVPVRTNTSDGAHRVQLNITFHITTSSGLA
jgi:hypothetical protein